MENEQIISTLTARLGQTQLSSRTIATYVENNLLGEGGNYDDAYFDRHANILKSLGGQYSADVAKQINAFKADWEKDHQTPKVDPTPKNKESSKDDKYEALFKEIQSLKDSFKGEQTRNAQETLRKKVIAKGADLKVSNTYLWNKVVSTTAIEEGMTQSQLLEEVKNTYEEELRNIIGSGATPYGTSGSPKPQEPNKVVQDFFAKKKASMAKK